MHTETNELRNLIRVTPERFVAHECYGVACLREPRLKMIRNPERVSLK